MRRVFMTSSGEIKIFDFGSSEDANVLKPRREHDLERLKKLTEHIKSQLAIRAEIDTETVVEYNEIAKRYSNE